MAINDPTYFIGGCNVGVYNSATLVIEPFAAWLWNGSSGGDIINLTTTLYPDMRNIGLNGVDVNPNGQGNMCPDGCYDIYMIYNPTTQDVGFICSLSGSWGGVRAPSGYTWYRKLMYGVLVYGRQLAANHTANWPMPTVMLSTPILITEIKQASTNWITLDLSKYTPENSRYAWYRIVCLNSPVNAYLAPTASTQYAKLVSYNQLGVFGGLGCRIQGGQLGYAQMFNGGEMDIYLDGWSQTEVS